MGAPDADGVERRRRESGQRAREQTEERALVEAMFEDALQRQRDQVNLPPPIERPPGTHHTELPEAEPGHPLALEWNTYRREIGRLLAEGNEGKYVLIKGGQVLGIFESCDAAYGEGLKRFLGEAFFMHPIRTEEPYLRIRGLNHPWPASLSR